MSDLKALCFGSGAWPTVSVVMPVRNEALHLERSISSILSQEYPLPFDLCLAVAPSEDDTAELAATIAGREPRLTLVHNPAGATPAGLNAAIAATGGEVVVRVDGHAELSDGYIRRAVETMRRTGAVNVGGIQAARGETAFEQAVAAAMTSWLGTGGSRFHVGGSEGPVDTVYLGVFDRAAGDHVGWFDEALIRNQDYEFNIRLRDADGTIWFDPALTASYRPRGSLGELARQYHDYGYWKALVGRKHPRSLRPRQILPAILPLVLGAAGLAGVRRRGALVVPISYGLAIAGGAVTLAAQHRVRPHHTATALATMQLAWGVGFQRAVIDQITGGRPSRVNRHTVRQRIGRRSTLPRQPDHHPAT